MKKILLTATVQSHICQFHKPLVQMLRENGDFEIHVAARDNLGEKNGLKLDFVDKVYDVPFERSPFDPKNIKAYRELKRIINRNDYDYIHCNTPVGGVVTRLAARKARKKGSKVFYTAHGFHFYQGASKKNWLTYYPVERMLARLTDTLITINDEDYALAREKFSCSVAHMHGVGVDPTRYHAVSSEEGAEVRRALGVSESDRILLCVGELLPNKNQEMAIRCMQRLASDFPDVKLFLAGNGPRKEELRQLVEELGIADRVVFLGYCTNLEQYQRIASISVSCSYREGLPLNIIEAMMTKKPVVATHNRGHNELVTDGETGYLVDAGDVEGLHERIAELLAHPDRMNEMGERGFEIAQEYGFENVKAELKRIYFE